MTPTETLDQIAKLQKGTLFVQNAGLVLGTYESYFNDSNLKALREYIEQLEEQINKSDGMANEVNILTREVKSLEQKNAILREGVEHYSDKRNWQQTWGSESAHKARIYIGDDRKDEHWNGYDHAINVLAKVEEVK